MLSHAEAASIIGTHFTEVSDKLLNTLQLKDADGGSKDLIEASIQQKVEELKPVPFQLAIDFKKNRKYLKYALIPLLVIAPSSLSISRCYCQKLCSYCFPIKETLFLKLPSALTF